MATLPASAATSGSSSGKTGSDIRHVGADIELGKDLKLDVDPSVTRSQRSAAPSAARVGQAPPVGTVQTWMALNAVTGRVYLKSYTLRGVGANVEVWVANSLAFPTAADCRNTLGLTAITDAQVAEFVREFDATIYPKESAVFSTPPARDGSAATLPGLAGLPADYYTGKGDNIVTLVDNVRDENYFDPLSPNGRTYIAGFFSRQFNEFVDRNVMTVDAFDWLHRSGANPPDDSADPAYQACSTALQRAGLGTARPRSYEGVFAHEYQHLLHSYTDPDEVSWINEGLSDWAETLVGYGKANLSPDDPKADGHISSFLGFNGTDFGGPENSLTLWEDQGAPEILADYGAAWTFMEFLQGRYGTRMMTLLHRESANGLPGLDASLKTIGKRTSSRDILHDWAVSMAVDQAMERARGRGEDRYEARTLSAKVDWNNPQAYQSPGAPPNGSDYVRLRDAQGRYLRADQLGWLTFQGNRTLTPDPLEWTVAAAPPDGIPDTADCATPPAAGTGAAALYSGCGDMLDRAAVRSVAVPATGATLTFDALWDIEPGWDFAVVQVSTDGGKTYTTLPATDTTSDHDPGAIDSIVAQLPGFTGESGGWKPQTVDLGAYAGKTVLLSLRYLTDPASTESGFWVRNVALGGAAIPTGSLDGWRSRTQVSPVPVSGYTVYLVGYTLGREVFVERLRLLGGFTGFAWGKDLRDKVGKRSDTVAVIVMYDEPTEQIAQTARYTLTVNGVVQPGG